MEVDSPWRQVDPPRAVQWAFDISYELRTGVAAGVGIYLAGRILLLVCELRFCICIFSALFLHCVSCRCMYYVKFMYAAPVFPCVNFLYFSPLQPTEACASQAILVSGIKDPMLKPAAAFFICS